MRLKKNFTTRLFTTAVPILTILIAGCDGSSKSSTSPPTITAPTVSTTSPTADQNRIATDASLTVTFSRAIALSSVDSTQFKLWHYGSLVPALVTFDGTTATLTPEAPLNPSALYSAELNSGIVDTDGENLEEYHWAFYTAGNGWSADALIESNDAGDAEDVQISVNADGNALAVWSQDDGNYYSIFANRYTVGTGWGSAELIESNDIEDANSPQISVDADGNALAVWQQYDGNRVSIFANRHTAGTGWGTAELIESNDAAGANAPQISVGADGNALVVWQQSDGNRDSIFANRYTVGTGWGTAGLIESNDTGYAYDPQIDIDINGNALAVWIQVDGTRDSIFANRYTVDTGWGTAELIESNDTEHASDPQITVTADGNAFAVWLQSDGTRPSIFSNRYTVGTGWGTAELIESNDIGGARTPQVSVDTDGNALAVWQQYEGTSNSIFANRHTAGAGWGTAELIESSDSGAYRPQISFDADGNALAVWYQYDETTDSVFANRYTVGTGWGSAELIESDDAGANAPQISVDANGNALVVWAQNGDDTTNIKSARFDPRVIAP